MPQSPIVYSGTVTAAPPHTSVNDGNYHVVYVSMRGIEDGGHVPCAVMANVRGDVNIPSEGTPVLIADVNDTIPIVLGTYYDPRKGEDREKLPTYDMGERVIGHDATDSHVGILPRGPIEIVSNNLSVMVNGTAQEVVIENGGGDTWTFGSEGSFTTKSLTVSAEDLTARTPEVDEVAKHDGTGTPSESLCFEQGDLWYNIADGNTF